MKDQGLFEGDDPPRSPAPEPEAAAADAIRTRHQVRVADARDLGWIPPKSVQLVVTSPPYPMIEMWDGGFGDLNPRIAEALDAGRGPDAFEWMHAELDRTWREAYRVLADGGFACINIGDATRTIDGNFRLYANHARVLEACLALGFQNLPAILWRKPTNAPTKFMGSGMLPAGAYVTLEHEYVLVLRKGEKRAFRSDQEKRRRRESAFFWEERNTWFSDVWFDIVGTAQDLMGRETRDRSGAFPFELVYRLVNMFSVKHDTVLDPFLGTGTTTLAAMASERNSIGLEIEPAVRDIVHERFVAAAPAMNGVIRDRLGRHVRFVAERAAAGKPPAHQNAPHDVACVSAQETDLVLRRLASVQQTGPEHYEVVYEDRPCPTPPPPPAAPRGGSGRPPELPFA